MRYVKSCICTIVSLGVILVTATVSLGDAPAGKSAINPVATEILKRMTDYLGTEKQFRVKTENTLEYLLDSGHRIDIGVSADVIISRPNKLRAERHGKLVDQIFFYDGKELTLYNTETGFYATEPVPDTYKALFQHMAESFGFGVPISDLILKEAYTLLMEEVNLAAFLGRNTINGVMCDQLLFSRPGVDFQVWVAVGDKPVPCKYVVTDTASPDRLSIRTRLYDWDFSPLVQDADFAFTPPEGAQKIEFLPF